MTARCIMVLGTSSGAGKSWIATALCRHYANQGLKVAPFKAQNMSNNARVVAGGVAPSSAGGGWGLAAPPTGAAGPSPQPSPQRGEGVGPARLGGDMDLLPLPPAGESMGEGAPSPVGGGLGWGPAARAEGAGAPLGEIGSAQYFQALAARAEPDVRMNPLLLKPEADTCSQVVLMGQANAELSALPWRGRSERVWPQIAAALDALRAENDVVVIEGAGSPAEINLMASDVVNLRVARHADARCLLVADIDRGGAFAHLYGTWALLPEADRARIRGFVLNKFRGDASLLAPAPEQLQQLTAVPTVAVVPMRFGHGLPEEDGVFDDGGAAPSPQPSPASGRGSEQSAARNASCASPQPSPASGSGSEQSAARNASCASAQPFPASARKSEQAAARRASCASPQTSPQRGEGARPEPAHPDAVLPPLPLAGEGRGEGLAPSSTGGRPGWGLATAEPTAAAAPPPQPSPSGGGSKPTRVAIVAYPRISNLDEFQPLKNVPGVSLTWARTPAALAGADWIILPGSKATAADLAWLRAQRLDAAIAAHAARGGRVLGICGGLQMLGEALIDLHGVEPEGNGPGLGLLPLVTRFEPDKTVRHATRSFGDVIGPWSALASVPVSGYEIHSGRTAQHPAMAAQGDVAREVMAGLAWQNLAGNVLGVYLHGLFEDAAVLRALFGAGAPSLGAVFDGLADAIERAFEPGVLAALIQ